MNKPDITQKLIYVPQTTLGFFIILNIMAMIFYKGGTMHNPDTINYNPLNNFLSDLGRTISFSNKTNFHASLCFNMSMIISGFSFISFFYYTRQLFSNEKKSTIIISNIGASFGILSSVCMIGVGFTPADIYLPPHILFAHWMFRFYFITALCFSISIYKSDSFENKYGLGYVFFTIVILIYILISELGPSPRENYNALTLQVITQKVILVCFLYAIYSQTKGISKILK